MARAQRSLRRALRWKGAFLLLALIAGACAPQGYDDDGDFVLQWEPGGGEVSSQLRKSGIFENYVSLLNQRFKLPEDLRIVHSPCGENAYYYPSSRTLYMCYELFEKLGVQHEGESVSQYNQRLTATWTFFFFHELGHALVDLYQLPVLGKEEDAVDGFASILLIETRLTDYARLAADYWNGAESTEYDDLSFADEHSLDAQRFVNILCLVYGSNPPSYETLVTDGELPSGRAQKCSSEYKRALKSWRNVLRPWLKH